MTNYRTEPTQRHKLPDRRPSETLKILFNNKSFYLNVGYDPKELDPETGLNRPREVFYAHGFTSGSEIEFLVQDTCILISLLLQHGFYPSQIAKSLSLAECFDPSSQVYKDVEASTIGAIVLALRSISKE